MIHPIAQHLAETGSTIDAYAAAAGRSTNAIYKYLQGKRRPRMAALKQLSDATGGKVSVTDLINFYDTIGRPVVPEATA